MSVYYTADLHFFHRNIIKLCDRPFHDLEHMHKELRERFNATVKPSDTVYMLGDMGFNPKKTVSMLKFLNGKKHLIIGNHDHGVIKTWDGWESVSYYKEINDCGRKVILFHYPILEWNGQYRDSIHLHGHSHGNIQHYKPNIFDVGVDCHGYRPVTLRQLLEKE